MTLYLDTSSVVKLYVHEPGSDAVRAEVDEASVVATSAIAYPEARAALARRRREGVLSSGAFASAKRSFEDDWPRYLIVEATSGLCRRAGDLAERYRLRACDSVHLASFADVAAVAGVADTVFSSYDDALNRAARSLRRSLARATRQRASP